MKNKKIFLITTAVLLIIANTRYDWMLLRVVLFLIAGAIICSIIKDINAMKK